MARYARIVVTVMFLSVAVLGCSSEPSRYVVTGTVTMDGAPAPFVVVSFLPAAPDEIGGSIAPTDSAGKFSMGEEGKNTGLPRGEYKVAFSQTLVKGKPTLAGSGGKAAEKDPTEMEAVADEYRDPKQTPITATVKSGTNTFTFDIKAKK